jgi:hypothetical protein
MPPIATTAGPSACLETRDKPRLIYFQYRYDPRLPPFLLLHKNEQVKCLSAFFHVTVVNDDCNYERVCELYRPDVALFESGVSHDTCRKPRIEDVRRRPDIPKIALHHGDAFCNARAGFLSDVEHWGIDTFFAISTTAAEHTPEIAEGLFVWPVFVDPATYHNYHVWKSIPVLLTGNTNSLYPWRQRVYRRIAERYPALNCPHVGYTPGTDFAHVLVGERYARTLSASWCVPACGTVARDVVRKHFEVPACGACLITERSAAVEAAGFQDLVSCVFADDRDVVDKLAWLFEHPDVLERIIDSGQRLVSSRHTLAHRNQIYEWFMLHRTLKPTHKIVQLNPFDAPVVVERSSGRHSEHVRSNGRHLRLLSEGDARLWRGEYEAAQDLYRACINHMRWMPEPKLRMALCSLYIGDADAAIAWLEQPIRFVLEKYGAADPDPVEWAYLIIALICKGRLDEAEERAATFPGLVHTELDRARMACRLLTARPPPLPLTAGSQARRRTVHCLPERSDREWLEQICVMLSACAASNIAKRLRARAADFERALQRSGTSSLGTTASSVALPRRRSQLTAGQRFRAPWRWSARVGFGSVLKRMLQGVETRYGYFLPYRYSLLRSDPFFRNIFDIARYEDIDAALIIGASPGDALTEAFLAGLRSRPPGNLRGPIAYCVRSACDRKFVLGRRSVTDDRYAKWYRLPDHSDDVIADIRSIVRAILVERGMTSFDALLIAGESEWGRGCDLDLLQRARFVCLEGVNHAANFTNQSMLCGNSMYAFAVLSPDVRDGCATFRRIYPECEPEVRTASRSTSTHEPAPDVAAELRPAIYSG